MHKIIGTAITNLAIGLVGLLLAALLTGGMITQDCATEDSCKVIYQDGQYSIIPNTP